MITALLSLVFGQIMALPLVYGPSQAQPVHKHGSVSVGPSSQPGYPDPRVSWRIARVDDYLYMLSPQMGQPAAVLFQVYDTAHRMYLPETTTTTVLSYDTAGRIIRVIRTDQGLRDTSANFEIHYTASGKMALFVEHDLADPTLVNHREEFQYDDKDTLTVHYDYYRLAGSTQMALVYGHRIFNAYDALGRRFYELDSMYDGASQRFKPSFAIESVYEGFGPDPVQTTLFEPVNGSFGPSTRQDGIRWANHSRNWQDSVALQTPFSANRYGTYAWLAGRGDALRHVTTEYDYGPLGTPAPVERDSTAYNSEGDLILARRDYADSAGNWHLEGYNGWAYDYTRPNSQLESKALYWAYYSGPPLLSYRFLYLDAVPVAAEPRAEPPAMRFWPNPARGFVHIQGQPEASGHLTDAVGRQMASFRLNGVGRAEVPISNLAAGLYTVRSGGNAPQRLVVE